MSNAMPNPPNAAYERVAIPFVQPSPFTAPSRQQRRDVARNLAKTPDVNKQADIIIQHEYNIQLLDQNIHLLAQQQSNAGFLVSMLLNLAKAMGATDEMIEAARLETVRQMQEAQNPPENEKKDDTEGSIEANA